MASRGSRRRTCSTASTRRFRASRGSPARSLRRRLRRRSRPSRQPWRWRPGARGEGPAPPPSRLLTGLAACASCAPNSTRWVCPTRRAYEIDFRLARKERAVPGRAHPDPRHSRRSARGRRRGGAGTADQAVACRRQQRTGDVAVKSVQFADSTATPPACDGRRSSGAALTCATPNCTSADVRCPTPYWTPRKDAARYDFEPECRSECRSGRLRSAPPLRCRSRGADVYGGAHRRVSIQRSVRRREANGAAGRPAIRRPRLARYRCGADADARRVEAASAPVARPAVHVRTVEVTVSNNQKGRLRRLRRCTCPTAGGPRRHRAPVKFERENEDADGQVQRDASGRGQAGRLRRRCGGRRRARACLVQQGYEVVEYPHIHRRHVVEPAQTRVKVIDVKIAPGLSVGYVMGVGDAVPAAIEQLGAEVHLIDAAELASGDLVALQRRSSPACAPTSAGRTFVRTTTGC